MIEQKKKDIPPGLLRIVKENKPSKKFFLLIGLSMFLVFTGVGAVYFYTQYFSPEIKNQPNLNQAVIQNIPKAPAQNEAPIMKETNKAETISDFQAKEIITDEKINYNDKSQKQTKTIKIAKSRKTENEVSQKQMPFSSIDTFKGADYLYRAQDYEQKGMLNEAINEYKEYINYSGKAEPRILNKIAILYLFTGNLKEANHYAELAIQSSKNSKEMLINYGVIKAKMGDLNKAEESFNKVLSLEPENKTALFNLALIKEQKGDYKEAFRLYEKLYQLGDLSVASSLERLKAYK